MNQHPRIANMRTVSISTLAAVAALGAPAAASAAGIQTGVSAVQAHTTHADAALTRAVSLFKHGSDSLGTKQFTISQKQLGLAQAAAAKLQTQAHTPSAKAQAAQAMIDVAKQDQVSITTLSALVPDASGKVQNQIAQAALSDTTGQTKALAVLAAVALNAPAQAQAGLTHAIEAISTATQSEVSAEANAAADNSDSTTSADTLASAAKAAVSGQNTASGKLSELIASSSTPASALPGLQKAYSAVITQQGSIANILSHLSSHMPASVRAFVGTIITQARGNASSMQNNHPTPPTGNGAGSHPTGSGTGSNPTGSGTSSNPTGSGTGSNPTGSGAVSHPTGS
ncbi:MAG TPA: hypothetical protein VFN87_21545 [Solirubrobacteraceae bacterium]|nr:hypothetical protein [Solirubrobacteraceae bacterium]